MRKKVNAVIAVFLLGCSVALSPIAQASSKFEDTIATFKKAEETEYFFNNAYGYAIFPTVGKAGFVIGGAHGSGRVYKGGVFTGTSTVSELSFGLQAGGQAYSEIIFFEDERAYRDFTSGSFELGAQASAVAINLGANAQTGTSGNSANAGQSGGEQNSVAGYVNGMTIFVSAKGGLMLEASVAGQVFTFDKI